MATLTIQNKTVQIQLVSLDEPYRHQNTVATFGGTHTVPGRWIWGKFLCHAEVDALPIDTGKEGVLEDDSGKKWQIVTEQVGLHIVNDPPPSISWITISGPILRQV
jgi:hypothetical protein